MPFIGAYSVIGLAFCPHSVGLSEADSPQNDPLSPYPWDLRSGVEVDVVSSKRGAHADHASLDANINYQVQSSPLLLANLSIQPNVGS